MIDKRIHHEAYAGEDQWMGKFESHDGVLGWYTKLIGSPRHAGSPRTEDERAGPQDAG